MRSVSSIRLSVLGLAALCLMDSLALNISGSVGSNISVSCGYPETYQNNSKYFYQVSGWFSPGGPRCVRVIKGQTRSEHGRLALLDDTSARVLTSNISELTPEDSGKYWCGVDVALLPDFASEIWLTVTKEHPLEQTTDLFSEEPGEYSRFMMMVALMCVSALFFVCLFGLFQVLKHKRHRDSVSVLHCSRTMSNPAPRVNLPDSSTAQSDKAVFYRGTDSEAFDTDDYCPDAVSDHIYTRLDPNRQSHVYQSLMTESIHHSIDQTHD